MFVLPIWLQTALLLLASNVFMTFAWYGHLKHKDTSVWYVAALVSWGIALFEYLLQVQNHPLSYFCIHTFPKQRLHCRWAVDLIY